jgi:hypothetical protein
VSLNRHQVRYVIIGAFAAIAQPGPIPATRVIDITPDASGGNLTVLSRALTDLGARIRTETSLAAAEVWNLIWADGEFHISSHPSGGASGYAQLAAGAHRLRGADVEVVVADLTDVIHSKE